MIREWLKDVLKSEKYSSYGLILVNSIQYQCSLGFPTKYFRDEVFWSCWESFGKNNFTSRFKEIYKFGDIVLNCCTKGEKKPGIRKMVDFAIKQTAKEALILRRAHPVNWFLENRRNTSWKT